MALPSFFRSDQWVKTTTGQAVSGAHVYWLTQPTTSVPASESLIPAPQASVFADPAGVTPLVQPVVTDGFGHADAYIASGIYTVAVYINGSLQQAYADQGVAVAPSSGVSGVTSLNALTGALSITAGTAITVTPSGTTVQIAGAYTAGAGITITGASIAATGSLPTATLGDIARFNVNGDGAWDAVSYVQKFTLSCATTVTNTLSLSGYVEGTFQVSGGTLAQVKSTATQTFGISQTTSSATSNTIGMICSGFAGGGTNLGYNIMAWFKCTHVFSMASIGTSARYWWGIGVYGNGGTLGTNATAIVGTTALATDTPNKSLVGWRFSNSTDTHNKAVAVTAGGSTTIVDTGITPDTNSHKYEMVQNFAGTSVLFYIDNSLVATISTNLPPAVTSNLQDALAGPFLVSDNKNSANLCGFIYYWNGVSWRG